jgi:hypothetical protein
MPVQIDTLTHKTITNRRKLERESERVVVNYRLGKIKMTKNGG